MINRFRERRRSTYRWLVIIEDDGSYIGQEAYMTVDEALDRVTTLREEYREADSSKWARLSNEEVD